MTPLRIKLGLSVPLLALALVCGCHKQAPKVAPVPAPEATPVPAVEKPAPQPEATPTPSPSPEQTEPATEKPVEKKPVRKHPIKKPVQEKPAVQEAKNTLPAHPGATAQPSPPTISPAPATATPGRDQAAIDQLLQTAQNNLNGIKRDLSQDEKDMVTQIKAFIAQSREATRNHDQVRAYTLANKARLLSDALAKP
jgi:outer membrane biosynthesis protein TonB